MKFLQLIVLSALFAMILNDCSQSSKDECQKSTSPDKTDKYDYRCCWYEAKYKKNKDDSDWKTDKGCQSTPYDGDLISYGIKVREAEIKFLGGDVDSLTLDCSASWIHSFFGLVLLLAFTL